MICPSKRQVLFTLKKKKKVSFLFFLFFIFYLWVKDMSLCMDSGITLSNSPLFVNILPLILTVRLAMSIKEVAKHSGV
jgi:hypothetical protein